MASEGTWKHNLGQGIRRVVSHYTLRREQSTLFHMNTLSEQLDQIYAKAVALDEIQQWVAQNPEILKGFPEGSQFTTVMISLLTELKTFKGIKKKDAPQEKVAAAGKE